MIWSEAPFACFCNNNWNKSSQLQNKNAVSNHQTFAIVPIVAMLNFAIVAIVEIFNCYQQFFLFSIVANNWQQLAWILN